MSLLSQEFKVGDYVFAKIKGYNAWPARIKGKREKKKTLMFYVKFYGTYDFRWVPGTHVFPYNQHNKLLIRVRTKLYLRSISELEEDLAEAAKRKQEEKMMEEDSSSDTSVSSLSDY